MNQCFGCNTCASADKKLEDVYKRQLYGRYRDYLKKRFRPAMEKLIRARETENVKVLFGLAEVTSVQMDELLALAQKYGNTECVLWLLSKKEEQFGFGGKDMEL